MKTFTKVSENKLKSRTSQSQPSHTQVVPDRHKELLQKLQEELEQAEYEAYRIEHGC